eukprot:scaffold10476_cov142-Cylindrotheca_fusiformis.AAC.5
MAVGSTATKHEGRPNGRPSSSLVGRSREGDCEPREEVLQAIADGRDVEEMAISLLEERNLLLRKLQKLQAENEELKNENHYGNLLMRRMMHQSRKLEKQNKIVANALDDEAFLGIDLDGMCLPQKNM